MPSVLITGVSSGIGLACTRRFAQAGWTVIGTLRDTGKRPDALADGTVCEQLDLAERGSGSALATRVIERHGCPDVLINNAGTLQWGPLEYIGPEELERLYQVNVFGQMELIRGLLPAMRERGSGVIANVTSLGGRMVFPFFAGYNSTKWAFEGVSEGLWHELRPFGVKVKTIEPGFVETAIWSKALFGPDGEALDGPEPYGQLMGRMAAFEQSITKRTSPDAAAEQVFSAVTDPSARLRYPVAAYARSLVRARRLLGDAFMMRFFHERWIGDKAATPRA